MFASGIVVTVGLWLMNQCRSIRGRDQATILFFLGFSFLGPIILELSWSLEAERLRGCLHGNWLDNCKEQMGPFGEDCRDHVY